MSPIQWRRWRRRSDEIKYWRESTVESSPDLLSTGFAQPPVKEEKRETAIYEGSEREPRGSKFSADDDQEMAESQDGFDFGLPNEPRQSQEHVSLEERVVTLEVKLMDFEYAISRLQASHGPGAISDRIAPGHATSQSTSSINRSPTVLQNPGQQSNSFSMPRESISTNPRPTSIATTLKPTPGGQYSPSIDRFPGVRDSRSSITSLTVEHYTTLITLIRREQAARIRLEDQVAELQRQLQRLQSPPNSSRQGPGGQGSQGSPSHQLPHHERRRSSNYGDETDTDESFHDVYVTPVERGELERQDLDERLEGVAF